jgi:hypothetical protein
MTIIDNKGIINVIDTVVESIDDDENTIFIHSNNGNYYHIAYKRLMQGVLKDRKEVTHH